MVKRIFSLEDDEFIKSNYKTMTLKEMADVLGKTPKQVKGRRDSLKLFQNKTRIFTQEERNFIKKMYNKVETKEIAEQLNATVKKVSDSAYGMGLRREITRYELDECFFEKVDSEEKAYWLGFMYADGYIYKRYNKNTHNIKEHRLELCLSIEDEEHIDKFKKSLKYDGKKSYKKITLDGKEFYAVKVTISNRKLCSDIEKLGCYQNKSLTLTFPTENQVPLKFQRDFIRGYFDGDGCTHYSNKTNSYIHNIVGTEMFLMKIQNILHSELGFSKVKMYKKGNAFQMSYGGYHNFCKFHEYIYKDATIFLDRKYQKGIEGINRKIA